ncbi:MAG: two-component regulator propeller domain-containing protein [Verrucomicrobiae bacterium]|nr:two-component regulator propeller domain-containing protein [Verrucomicrobiae bacterium]
MLAALFICQLMAGGRLEAQTDFFARLWQAENGLPNNIVQAITQTQDGYLWVGTREGLARFDGEQFNPVYLFPQTSEPSITCLHESRDGSLWVGTDGRGIFRLYRGGVQRCYPPGGDSGLIIFGIQESGDGAVWFDTVLGVLRWADGKMEWRFESNRRKSICADNTGKMWVLDGNLIRADLPEATNYFARNGLLPRTVRQFYCDHAGVFWIGADTSAGNDLIQINQGKITKFPRERGPAGFPSVVFHDSAGELWVGSYEGLSRLVDGKFIAFPNLNNSPSSYRIYSIFEDREQNLWIGSDEGLTRLTPKRFKTLTKKDGLASNTALAVSPSKDGSVWVSSWGSGLSHYVDGRIEVLSTSNGLPSNFVMASTETRDGSFWVGTDYGGPLVRIKNGAISVFDHKQGYGIGHGTPALYEDDRGVLWIGCRGLLQTWDGARFKTYTKSSGLSDIDIDAICGGKGGVVWIGTISGLTRWQDGKFEDWGAHNPLFRCLVLSLYEDADGTLWMGAKGKGLLRWHNGVVNQFTHKCGLFSDSIYAILEDAHSNLWFNSSRGVFRVDKRQLEAVAAGKETAVTSISYGTSDGILASSQYYDVTQPAACKDAQGRMWFRTTQGVAVVDPETAAINALPPPVVIQQIIVDNQPMAAGNLGREIPGSMVIPPGNGSLEVHYAALSYRATEKNLYRYRLEGVDAGWVNSGNERVAKYNNLRPGRYYFRVMACNNDGVWNQRGQSVELIFQPHFWQTWWFLTLMVTAAAGTVGGTVRYFTRRRMQRKLNELEKQRAVECERSRIARDVHDQLGARLTSISFQGSIAKCSLNDPVEMGKQIDQMSASAREAVSSLHEIVWAVDPQNDSLEGLVAHISQQVEELFGNSTINCEVMIPEPIPPVHLSASVRHNLFLAIMEAANNAAKHSRATRVSVQVLLQEKQLEILVADNGRGFEVAAVMGGGKDLSRRKGNGLANMRARLESAGGRFKITSDPKQGTTIRLSVALEPRTEA